MKQILRVYGFLICISFLPSFYKAQCPAVSVPYFENFSSITVNNQFPACWNSTNPGVNCLSFAAPLQCAAFNFSPAATSHFFTKAVQLYSGVNYSVSAWYKVSTGAPGNWTNFSLQLGTNQSSLGLTGISSTSGILTNTAYTALSGTFSVGSSGIYYFSISATGSPTANAQYLYWDDFEIKAPCSINPINLIVVSSSTAVCAGQCASISASGADQYMWNNGSTGTMAVYCFTTMSSIIVAGTNTASGCTFSASTSINVNPSPVVSAVAIPSIICLGTSAQLQAFGADTYSWGFAGVGNSVLVSPTTQTTYTVTGTNSFGCQSSGTVTVKVSVCSSIADDLMTLQPSFFPNPIKENLQINNPLGQFLSLTLTSLNGSVIFSRTTSLITENLDLKEILPGVYILSILREDGKLLHHKILKE